MSLQWVVDHREVSTMLKGGWVFEFIFVGGSPFCKMNAKMVILEDVL